MAITAATTHTRTIEHVHVLAECYKCTGNTKRSWSVYFHLSFKWKQYFSMSSHVCTLVILIYLLQEILIDRSNIEELWELSVTELVRIITITPLICVEFMKRILKILWKLDIFTSKFRFIIKQFSSRICCEVLGLFSNLKVGLYIFMWVRFIKNCN